MSNNTYKKPRHLFTKKLYIKYITFLLFATERLLKKHQKDERKQKVSWRKKISTTNLWLSLMKRIEDSMILRFISLVKRLLLHNNTRTTSFSLIFKISKFIALRSSKKDSLLMRNVLGRAWKSGTCLSL